LLTKELAYIIKTTAVFTLYLNFLLPSYQTEQYPNDNNDDKYDDDNA